MNPDDDDQAAVPPAGDDVPAPATGDPARPADVQAYIGRQLRAVYDDVVKQPIPDRFLDLMKQLEEQGSRG